jgi:hypothetical protein
LWLEKPISHSLDSGRQLLREITTDRTSFALINFSWLFSSVWEKFESLNLKVSDAATIEISQKAKEHTHKYIDAIEDYGSHDIALIYNWIKSNKKSTRELTIGNIEKSSFYATYDNLKIFWRVDFGQSKRNMNWLITWKDGSKTHIDFYGGSIVHDELELEFEKQDNINSFVSALFAKNQSLRRTNHEIALMTKEFFSKK